jgi:hypothetical protein
MCSVGGGTASGGRSGSGGGNARIGGQASQRAARAKVEKRIAARTAKRIASQRAANAKNPPKEGLVARTLRQSAERGDRGVVGAFGRNLGKR